jgi:hypothetical protein
LQWAEHVQIYPTIKSVIEGWLQASMAMSCNPLCALLGACHDDCAGAAEAKAGVGQRTGKDGEDGLVDGLDLARVQDVAGEEGDDEQDDEDG